MTSSAGKDIYPIPDRRKQNPANMDEIDNTMSQVAYFSG
jgi:hypothetical protein